MMLRRVGRVLPSLVIVLAVLPAALYAQTEAADPVMVGAGDIATCPGSGDEATAALLDTIDGTVFTLGDNVYPDGTATDFANCYDPSWGRHKARTRPAVGNHEYHVPGATGHFDYFGAAAGDPAKGYYSYDRGAWHILVINSNCAAIGGCQADSAQERWVRSDLAAHPTTCTLAMWHHPRFSSGRHGSAAAMQPIWQALYEAGADLVLSGHDHNYERFAPQNAAGVADPKGMREFVVGTGGAGLRPLLTPIANSEVRNSSAHGVLKLTLHASSYDWAFIPVAGSTFRDSGSSTCTPSTQPSGNLLLNWSFEADNAPVDGKPDSWSIIPAFTRGNAVAAHHGSFVGQLSASTNTNHTVGQTVLNLSPGASYSFNGWVNIPPQADPSFAVRIQVRWLRADNSVIGGETVASYTASTAGWVRATGSMVTPANTAKARVQVVASSLNGRIHVDQFTFKKE